jgi:hypothetical protein
MTHALRDDYQILHAVKPCVRCGKPLTMQVFRINADAPNTIALHLACAMAEEGQVDPCPILRSAT